MSRYVVASSRAYEEPSAKVIWLLIFVVVVFSVVGNWLANSLALRGWARTDSLHWSERARQLYPIQVSAVWGLFVSAGCAGALAYWVLGETWNAPVVFGLIGFAGGLAGAYPSTRRCWPEWTFRSYLAACIKGWGFFLGLVAAAPLLAWGMGPEWSARSVVAIVAFLAVYLWYVTAGWLCWMRRLGVVKPASAGVDSLVREQAGLRGVRLSEVLFLEDFRASAFALPIQGAILLSPKLVSLLTTEELRTVVDHELGHLSESRGIVAGRVVGSLAYAPLPFLGVAASWHGLQGVVAAYLVWIAVSSVSKRLARAMEVRADRMATERPEAGAPYARALEKVYAENFIPASGISKNGVHPDLYDRMLAAGIQPDFERPKKPDYAHWTILIWIFAVFVTTAVGMLLR